MRYKTALFNFKLIDMNFYNTNFDLHNVVCLNDQTVSSFIHFKKNSWYKGINGDSGIITKATESLNKCHGWWSGTWVESYFRLANPENWIEITDKKEINRLDNLLIEELTK